MSSDIIMVLVAIGGVLLILILETAVIASRYKRVGPNEALIVSGRRRWVTNPTTGEREVVGFRIVRGGGTVIWPVLEQMDVLSLEVVNVPVKEVIAGQGAPLQVEGVVQVKIKGDEASIGAAAEHFLSQGAAEVENVVRTLFTGHLQAAVEGSAPGDVAQKRTAVAERVREALARDVGRMGLEVVSLNIQRMG